MSGAAELERRLFEILGGWVPSIPEPEAKLLLRAHSFQHAWHAELWESLGGAARRQPALGDVWPVVEALGAVTPVTADRLRAVYGAEGLLTKLVDAYRSVLAAASPLTDGALVRAVGLMVADLRRALDAGRGLLGPISSMRGVTEDARM